MFKVLCSRNVATRWPDFVMAKGHNIPESQGSLFEAEGRHSCYPKAERIYKSEVSAKIGTSSHTSY